MRVVCPGCASLYALPPHLLGPAGGRVTCPACGTRYAVDTHGHVAEAMPASDTAADAPVRPAAPAQQAPPIARATSAEPVTTLEPSPRALAFEALRALDLPSGSLVRDAAEGCLFAHHGPRLLDAFDAWRSRAGTTAPDSEFRDALRALTGLDVTPPAFTP